MTFRGRIASIPFWQARREPRCCMGCTRIEPVLDNKSDTSQSNRARVSMRRPFKQAVYWNGAVGKVFHNEKVDPGESGWTQMLRFPRMK